MIEGYGLDTFAPTSGTADGYGGRWAGLNSSSGYTRHWYDNLYTLVNRANTVIDMMDERTSIEYSSETRKAEIRATAVFFRGWAYRVLAGMYGNVPILDHRTTEIQTGYVPNTREEVGNSVNRISNTLQLIFLKRLLSQVK
jgi:hypothetical protein